jgi:hypothetical protein
MVLWVNAPAMSQARFEAGMIDAYARRAVGTLAYTNRWDGGRPIIAIVGDSLYFFPIPMMGLVQ